MKEEMYRRTQAAVVVVIGMGVAVSVIYDNIYLALAFVLSGMAVMYVSRKRVSGIMTDEMVHRISEKASMRAYQTFVPAAAFMGMFMVVSGWFPGTEALGQVIVYSALVLMLLYTMFYSHYSRRGNV